MLMDRISLNVPAKPEYILVTRLTTSAIASRMGFGLDEIEDIKVAVAEAGILLINQLPFVEELSLQFELFEDRLNITAQIQAQQQNEEQLPRNDEQSELSYYIIRSLMDDIKLHKHNNVLQKITMSRRCGG